MTSLGAIGPPRSYVGDALGGNGGEGGARRPGAGVPPLSIVGSVAGGASSQSAIAAAVDGSKR